MRVFEKQPVRVTMAYNFWPDFERDLYDRIYEERNRYIDISDLGTARLSKSLAQDFVVYLKNALASGSLPVAPKEKSSAKYRDGRVGFRTGEMYENIEAYRTNLGGEKKHHGWVVGIKDKIMTSDRGMGDDIYGDDRNFPLYFKLSWLEFGTVDQVDRPIIARGLEQYLQGGYVKNMVERMIAMGAVRTEAQRAKYTK